MITPVAPGVTLTPIINSGEMYHDFLFEGIPDGIDVMPGSTRGTLEVFVNHEQSRVPFLGRADFVDSSVSRLTLDAAANVVNASVPIPSSAGFLRFCSSFMAGPDEGFNRYIYFTNEETNDVVDVPPGAPYGPDPAVAPQRQAGYAVALDAKNGGFDVVPGMGRHNHENSVAIPGGWKRTPILSGDDTFNAPSSQLYSYLIKRQRDIWRDRGTLWAFRVTATDQGPVDPTDPFNGANDYGDIQDGDVWEGKFIRVPPEIAKGQTAERPQDALENWSNANNVFQFIRVEDIAYNVKNPRIVYFADTGERRALPDPTTGRLMRGPSGTNGPYPNGRIFRMVFDKRNPRKVDKFSIMLNGDAGGPMPGALTLQAPDNMDTSRNSLMVQEDSGRTPNSRIWRYDFATDAWSVVASVNDVDWESSGIVDVSEFFGPGSWLVDVQAHDIFVQQQQVGPVLFKREAGQLLLLKQPGS
jgi:Bacterial protein of unknown function (DUF839)